MYLLPFCFLFSGCFVGLLRSFLLRLVSFLVVWWFSLVLWNTKEFLFLCFLYTYCRFLVFGYHEVHICICICLCVFVYICMHMFVLTWCLLKFECILKALLFYSSHLHLIFLVSYFTSFYFVCLLIAYCNYSWFYDFFLLMFILSF